MLYNLAGYKGVLDAMMGKTETVTDHPTGAVLQFMDYQHDYNNYERRLTDLMSKK